MELLNLCEEGVKHSFTERVPLDPGGMGSPCSGAGDRGGGGDGAELLRVGVSPLPHVSSRSLSIPRTAGQWGLLPPSPNWQPRARK